MNVEIKRELPLLVPPINAVVITLTEQEAKVLFALTASIGGWGSGDLGITNSILHGILCGPDRASQVRIVTDTLYTKLGPEFNK